MGRLRCDLTGSKAVVVGASRGLGERIARVLASAGAEVVIGGRNGGTLRAAAERLGDATDVPVWPIAVDVVKWEDVCRFGSEAMERLGKVDVLVNVAGVQIRGPATGFSQEQWDTILNTNLRGTFRTCQVFGEHMAREASGSIINIASLNSVVALPERVPYCASKAGVVALTKGLALEWARSGVRVNAISPGYFKTEMTAPLFTRQDWMDRLMLEIPMGRVGNPPELDGAVLFLASDDSAYMTGQNLFVDGGFTAGELL